MRVIPRTNFRFIIFWCVVVVHRPRTADGKGTALAVVGPQDIVATHSTVSRNVFNDAGVATPPHGSAVGVGSTIGHDDLLEGIAILKHMIIQCWRFFGIQFHRTERIAEHESFFVNAGHVCGDFDCLKAATIHKGSVANAGHSSRNGVAGVWIGINICKQDASLESAIADYL